MLKNILGELDGGASTSTTVIAPQPIKSIRKQADEKELEMKKYMAKFTKKEVIKTEIDGEEILESLLKEEQRKEKLVNKILLIY